MQAIRTQSLAELAEQDKAKDALIEELTAKAAAAESRATAAEDTALLALDVAATLYESLLMIEGGLA